MSLRAKTLLATALILSALIAAVELVARQVLMNQFNDLERREVCQALSLGRDAVKGLQERVALTVRDWSHWDDTYHFVTHPSPSYVAANLSSASLDRLGLDVILFADQRGRVVYAAQRDYQGPHPAPCPLAPPESVLRRAGLVNDLSAGLRQGLLRLPAGLLQVASHPILTSEGRGPAAGYLICGRVLGPRDEHLLTRRLGVQVSLQRRHGPLPATALGPASMGVLPLSSQEIMGWLPLPDLRGGTAAVLTMRCSRDLHQQGLAELGYLVGLVAVVGVVLGLAVLLILERWVLRRLHRVSQACLALTEAAPHPRCLPDQGRDELGELVGRFNATLANLHRARQEGEAREALFRSVFESFEDVFVRCDASHRITLVSPSVTRVLGYSPEEVTGQTLTDLGLAQGDLETLVAHLEGRPVGLPEWQLSHQDGRSLWVAMRVQAHRDRQGGLLGYDCVLQDISQRQWDELALRLAEEKFRRLFAEASVGIFQASPDGMLLAANEALARMLDYPSPQELLQAEDGNVRVLGTDAVRGQEILSQAAASPAPVTVVHEYRTARGRTVIGRLKLRVVRGSGGEPQLLEGFVDDVTEQRRAEQQLSQTLTDLERSNTELEQFAYVASHDLQEPLRMISSYLQLLQRRYAGQLDTDADTFIGYAVEGAARMQRLISDLLAYSRVGTRGQEFRPASLEVALEEALANLEVARTETAAHITHDPLPTVWGDGTQLTQLLQNLLGNALKFRRPEAQPRIHVACQAADNGWEVAVQDNGIGLDPAYAERIFVIFQRLHNRDEYPGTGIGLAICKRIVERHGGRLWVDTDVTAGTTFRFTFPGRAASGTEASWAA